MTQMDELTVDYLFSVEKYTSYLTITTTELIQFNDMMQQIH